MNTFLALAIRSSNASAPRFLINSSGSLYGSILMIFAVIPASLRIDVTNAEGGYAFSYKRVNPEEKNNYFVEK